MQVPLLTDFLFHTDRSTEETDVHLPPCLDICAMQCTCLDLSHFHTETATQPCNDAALCLSFLLWPQHQPTTAYIHLWCAPCQRMELLHEPGPLPEILIFEPFILLCVLRQCCVFWTVVLTSTGQMFPEQRLFTLPAGDDIRHVGVMLVIQCGLTSPLLHFSYSWVVMHLCMDISKTARLLLNNLV